MEYLPKMTRGRDGYSKWGVATEIEMNNSVVVYFGEEMKPDLIRTAEMKNGNNSLISLC